MVWIVEYVQWNFFKCSYFVCFRRRNYLERRSVTNCWRKICNTTDIVYSIIRVIAMFNCCFCVSDSEVVAMFILDFHWEQRAVRGACVSGA